MSDRLFSDSIDLCPACRQPVAPDPRLIPEGLEPVAALHCPYCGVNLVEAQQNRMRHRQFQNLIP